MLLWQSLRNSVHVYLLNSYCETHLWFELFGKGTLHHSLVCCNPLCSVVLLTLCFQNLPFMNVEEILYWWYWKRVNVKIHGLLFPLEISLRNHCSAMSTLMLHFHSVNVHQTFCNHTVWNQVNRSCTFHLFETETVFWFYFFFNSPSS